MNEINVAKIVPAILKVKTLLKNNRNVEEILYPAMEDFSLDIII